MQYCNFDYDTLLLANSFFTYFRFDKLWHFALYKCGFKGGCKTSTWQAHIHYYLVSLSDIKSCLLLFLLGWYNYDHKLFCHCKSFSTNEKFTTPNTNCMSSTAQHASPMKHLFNILCVTGNTSIIYHQKENSIYHLFLVLWSLSIDQTIDSALTTHFFK